MSRSPTYSQQKEDTCQYWLNCEFLMEGDKGSERRCTRKAVGSPSAATDAACPEGGLRPSLGLSFLWGEMKMDQETSNLIGYSFQERKQRIFLPT